VSKERARRRAERVARQARAARQRARLAARRARWRALRRRVTGPLNRRRAWLLGRRRPGQRLVAVLVAAAVLAAAWLIADSWPTRVALILLALLVIPLVVLLLFPRKVH
jgi:Flp pilus assembly protein TadB